MAFMAKADALLGRDEDWLAFDVEAAGRAFGNEDPMDFLIASRLYTVRNLTCGRDVHFHIQLLRSTWRNFMGSWRHSPID